MLIHAPEDRDRARSLLHARVLLAYQARRVAVRAGDRRTAASADAIVDELLGLFRPLLGDTPPDKRPEPPPCP